MHCPHNKECTIEFVVEPWDNGDPNTPYFESGYMYIYDEASSEHIHPCTGLLPTEIEQLEKERNEEGPDYSWMEP